MHFNEILWKAHKMHIKERITILSTFTLFIKGYQNMITSLANIGRFQCYWWTSKRLLYILSNIKTHPENLFFSLVYPPAIIINLIIRFRFDFPNKHFGIRMWEERGKLSRNIIKSPLVRAARKSIMDGNFFNWREYLK